MNAEKKNPEREKFDCWLDTALRARVEAEPRMGIEARVLAKLATEPPRQTFSWMTLVLAAAVVVAVSAALIVTYSNEQKQRIAKVVPPDVRTVHHSGAPHLQASSTVPDRERSSKNVARRIARTRAPERSRAADHEHGLPSLATFPAPAPPTQQERMLAELARGANAKDLANFPETLVPLNDVEISSLRVDPLDNENNGPH